MTDRAHSVTVVFDKHIRVDDLQTYIDAFYLIKGVIAVQANVVDNNTYDAESRARFEIREKLLNIVREK